MKGMDRFLGCLVLAFVISPAAFSITIDRQLDDFNSLGIESFLTDQSAKQLKNLSCRQMLQSKPRDPALNACVAREEMSEKNWDQASQYWREAIQNKKKFDSARAGYYLGLMMSELKRKKYKNVQKTAQQALTHYPRVISLRYWLAYSYELDNKQLKALQQYKKITKLTPPQKAWLDRYYHANAIIKAGEKRLFSRAQAELKQFLEYNPDYYNGITLLAYVNLLLGEVNAAIINLKKAEMRIPNQPVVQRLFSQAYLIQGQYDKAIKSGKRFLKVKPNDVTGNYLVGMAYLKKGDPQSSVKYMKRVSNVNADLAKAKMALVLSYLSLGDSNKAQPIIKELLEANNLDLSTEITLLDVLIKLGQNNQVVSRSKQLLKEYPGNKNLRLILARAYSKKGSFAQSHAVLDKLLKEFPDYQAPYLAQARIYMMQKQFSKAEAVLNQYFSRWSSAEAHLLKGDLKVFGKQPKQALQAYKKAVEINPDSRLAWKTLIQYQVKQSQLKQAGLSARQLMLKHPDYADGYFFKGVVEYLEKNNAEARKLFQKAITLNPYHYRAYNHLALLSLEKPEAVEKNFLKSLEINKYQPVVYSQLATLYLSLKKKQEYDKLMKRWVAAIPRSNEPYEYMAKVYRQSGKFQEAANALEKAIKLNPQRSVNYLVLGDTYKRMAEFGLAEKTYKNALKIFPDSPVFLNNLAGSYIALNQYSNALVFAKKAEKLAPKSWKIKDTLANVYYLEGKYDKAIEIYKQALKLDNNSMLSFSLGKVYFHAGDKASAKKYLNTVSQSDVPLPPSEKEELKCLLAAIN